jgi:hypothetical protein
LFVQHVLRFTSERGHGIGGGALGGSISASALNRRCAESAFQAWARIAEARRRGRRVNKMRSAQMAIRCFDAWYEHVRQLEIERKNEARADEYYRGRVQLRQVLRSWHEVILQRETHSGKVASPTLRSVSEHFARGGGGHSTDQRWKRRAEGRGGDQHVSRAGGVGMGSPERMLPKTTIAVQHWLRGFVYRWNWWAVTLSKPLATRVAARQAEELISLARDTIHSWHSVSQVARDPHITRLITHPHLIAPLSSPPSHHPPLTS